MTETAACLRSVATLLVVLASPAWGGDDPGRIAPLNVHGFAMQSGLHTSDNAFAGASENGTLAYRTLGLNASYLASPDLLLAGQLVSHRFGSAADGDPHVDYALADYRLVHFDDGGLTARLGRVKNPIGLYNETRDIPTTMPSILLPQSVYLERSRALMLAADAVFLHYDRFADSGSLLIDAGIGYPQVDDTELEKAVLLNRDWDGRFRSRPSMLMRALYETPSGGLRLAATHAAARMEFDAHPGDRARGLGSGDVEIRYSMLSAQYETREWSLTGEYLRARTSVSDFGALLPTTNVSGDNFYVQGTWSPRHDIELLVRYDESHHDNDDPRGVAAQARSPALLANGLPAVAAHNNFGYDWTLGIRWNPSPDWTLRAEHHWVEGTTWLPRTDNPDMASTRQDWRLFAVSLGYQF